jgi:hypothetical protein
LVNNTLIANSSDARNGNGSVASLLGGAVFARQGKIRMANNVIAGNYASSSYGDIFKTDGAVQPLKYNLFGASSSINITPDSQDLFAGQDIDLSLNVLKETFDVSSSGNKLTGHAAMNGGTTPTIRITDENTAGLNVCIIPTENLQETILGIDLNNDGALNDYLQKDQRGVGRSLYGKACIGAYETGTLPSGTASVTDNRNLIAVSGNGFGVNSDYPFDYAVYDLQGRIIQSGKNLYPTTEVILSRSLTGGIYLIRVVSSNKQQAGKMIYR